MRGVRSLFSGLFVGLIIAATVFGALVMSVRGQPTSISELPIPTVTLQIVFMSPTPTLTPTARALVQAISPQPSALSPQTPTPTPTICPISPYWQRYSVGPFDTISSIAQRFNLTADQLVQANCLGKPVVTVGQTIYVPGPKPTPSASVPCYPPYNWSRAIVRPGDTLSSIAVRYGISVYTLMRANCLTTTYIYSGQVLYVPPSVPVVIFTPTPIIPIFTPTPPFGSFTPTVIPTTPAITVIPAATDTPGPTVTVPVPTDTPGPTSTSAPAETPLPTVAPTEPASTATPAPTIAPTERPLPTSLPQPTLPANTPEPPPANTPVAPVNTLAPLVNTPAPPANTSVPPPANTPISVPLGTTVP